MKLGQFDLKNKEYWDELHDYGEEIYCVRKCGLFGGFLWFCI